jgi:3-dehydroquinate synthase
MKKVHVSLQKRSYDILIGKGAVASLPTLLKKILKTATVLLVTSPVIDRLYGREIFKSLKHSGFRVFKHLLPEGERAKSQAELFRIYQTVLRAGLDRSSGIVALGGGAVGDVTGFAASTYLRGVAFINIPTTLLAQVDSAIGGKTAINLKEGKNLIGTFHQPRLVLCDSEVLRTLPEREYKSSLAEIVKYGVIASPGLFKFLEKNAGKLLWRDSAVLERVIGESVAIKARVVEKDEREVTGLRAILNFGHTFAHAYEKAAGLGRLLHGEAVAMGMCEAARLSHKRGLLSFKDMMRIETLILRLELPTSATRLKFKRSVLRQALLRDKKKKGDFIHFILADRIGHVRCVPLRPDFL